MKKTLRTLGLVALVFAITSWISERVFYGGIDANGVLQESFFLPLSFVLGAIGTVLLVVSFFLK